MKQKFPKVPKELLEELEKCFPDICPEVDLSIEAIRVKQGQVSVIRFLRAIFNKQTQNILEK